MKINKVLISDRGEVVCRIIKVLKKMQITSVAIFTEEDIKSKHTYFADEAYLIKSKSKTGYMDMDAIINIAIKANCDAIHPGIGFLSENHKFSSKVKNSGIRFIAPPTNSIKIMGNKILSKQFVSKHGIPTLKWASARIEDIAKIQIPLPAIIKLPEGGGGKFIKIAKTYNEIKKYADLLSFENRFKKKTFLMVEEYLENARHIEIQIIRDKYGNTFFMRERECSVQRRHQKIIEETPSCFLKKEIRKKMIEHCKKLVEAIGYYSSGTIEFLVNTKDQSFFFLEMNTRLQVEHMTTEMLTGVSIVEQMIRIENGEKINNLSVGNKGHSIECRIYAEDWKSNFAPSCCGQITKYAEPVGCEEGVIVESSVYQGYVINNYYDPMISKVIVLAKTRKLAIKKIKECLESYIIYGDSLRTNLNFLILVFNNKKFQADKITTNFVSENFTCIYNEKLNYLQTVVIATSAIYLHINRFGTCESSEYIVVFDQTTFVFRFLLKNNQIMIFFKNKCIDIFVLEQTQYLIRLKTSKCVFFIKYCIVNDFSFYIETCGHSRKINVYPNKTMLSKKRIVKVVNNGLAKTSAIDTNKITSPITGEVLAVYVKKGDHIGENTEVACIESMKMQNIIKSEKNFIISNVLVKTGQLIQKGQQIVEVEQD